MHTDDPDPKDGFSGFDLDASTAQSWDGFAGRLGEVLSVMDAGATLRIGAMASASAPTAPYEQFACEQGGRVIAEAAGNAELVDGLRLGAEDLAAFERLGWDRTGPANGVNHAGFRLEGTQENAIALAEATVRVLKEIFGVPHPAFLAPDQLADILTPPPVTELPYLGDPADLQVLLPRSKDDLSEAIRRELANMLGYEPVRDLDGDFGVRVGSTMVFVRATPDAQEVLVFAAIVHDIEGRSRAMEVLSDLNTDARYVRFLLIRDRVFVSLSVFAVPFVPAHLRHALRIVSFIGDSIDDELAARLRGRTTFDDTED